ncbi:hypothetical protein VDGL01_06043 [Verticillium dahliae]
MSGTTVLLLYPVHAEAQLKGAQRLPTPASACQRLPTALCGVETMCRARLSNIVLLKGRCKPKPTLRRLKSTLSLKDDTTAFIPRRIDDMIVTDWRDLGIVRAVRRSHRQERLAVEPNRFDPLASVLLHCSTPIPLCQPQC